MMRHIAYIAENVKENLWSMRQAVASVAVALLAMVVAWSDITSDFIGVDVVYLFRYPYDIGSFSRMLPLLAALVAADTVAQDYCDHMMPFMLIRMQPKEYIQCKYIVCAISGFVTIFVGWIIYVGLLGFRFPFVSRESVNYDAYSMSPFGAWIQNGFPMIYVLMYIFSAALCGSFWACMGLTISIFFVNRKIAIVSPFIINLLLYNLVPTSVSVWFSPSDVGKYIQQSSDGMTFLFMAGYFLILHLLMFTVAKLKFEWRCMHD